MLVRVNAIGNWPALSLRAPMVRTGSWWAGLAGVNPHGLCDLSDVSGIEMMTPNPHGELNIVVTSMLTLHMSSKSWVFARLLPQSMLLVLIPVLLPPDEPTRWSLSNINCLMVFKTFFALEWVSHSFFLTTTAPFVILLPSLTGDTSTPATDLALVRVCLN